MLYDYSTRNFRFMYAVFFFLVLLDFLLLIHIVSCVQATYIFGVTRLRSFNPKFFTLTVSSRAFAGELEAHTFISGSVERTAVEVLPKIPDRVMVDQIYGGEPLRINSGNLDDLFSVPKDHQQVFESPLYSLTMVGRRLHVLGYGEA